MIKVIMSEVEMKENFFEEGGTEENKKLKREKVLKKKEKEEKATGNRKKGEKQAKKVTKNKKKSKKDVFLIVIWILIAILVVVLALIVVLVILPTLARNERDQAREQDMAQFSNAVVKYQNDKSLERVNLPVAGVFVGQAEFPENCDENSACKFVRDYLNEGEENTFSDPDGEYYNLVITDNLALTRRTAKSYGVGETGEKLVLDNNSYEITSEGEENSHTFYLVPGAKCSGTAAVRAGKMSFAVLYNFESDGAKCLSGNA